MLFDCTEDNNEGVQVDSSFSLLERFSRWLHSKSVVVEPEETFVRCLGKGSFSRVMLDKHGRAHKLVSRNSDAAVNKEALKAFSREAVILSECDHPGIIRFVRFVQTEAYVGIITEACLHGDLFDFVSSRGHLNDSEFRPVIRQLLGAVAYLHSKGIIHRDLKLENVLIHGTNGAIKLADFGLARKATNGSLLRTRCGSEEYAAPEILRGLPYEGSLADAWSLGVISYACLCGVLPFDGTTPKELYQRVCQGLYHRMPEWVSKEAKGFVEGLLTVRVADRMSVLQALQHSYMI